MEKSFVGMAHHICPVCGIDHDPVVLINRRLQKNLTDKEFAGWKMCEEHMRLCHEGFTALIEVTNRPTGLADAVRSGRLLHVRNSAWANIFNLPLPDHGIAFVDPEAYEKLEAKYQQAHDEHICQQAELYGH
jgi:hypothetical protein